MAHAGAANIHSFSSPNNDRTIRIKEDFDMLQSALKLPPNSSPASTVCELQLQLRHNDETIAQLSQKAKNYDALYEAVTGITLSPRDRSVDNVIDRLQMVWRRQEKMTAYTKRRLDNAEDQLQCSRTLVRKLEGRLRNNGEKETRLKSHLQNMQDKISAVSDGFTEKQCGDVINVNERLAFRKEFVAMKQKCQRLEKELALMRENHPDGQDNNYMFDSCHDENTKEDIGTQTDILITGDDVQRQFEKDKKKTNDELAVLRFENEQHKEMVDKLRKVFSSFQKNVIIHQGSMEIAPVSIVDQTVLHLFSKTRVKCLDLSAFEPWAFRAKKAALIHGDDNDSSASFEPCAKKKANGDGIDRIVVEDVVIGKGAFGKVTLMRYVPTNIPVAVKVQERKGNPKSTMMTEKDTSNKLISRTMKEAVMHCVMSDNPSFPQMHGIVERGDHRLYMVLEFIGDIDANTTTHPLCNVLAGRPPRLSKPGWLDIAFDIASGLASLHDKGLLHNDLKANNILLQRVSGRWRAVIIDFGHGSTMVMPLQFPPFTTEEEREYCAGLLYQHLAPEIIRDRLPTSVYSDVYSLGVVLRDIARVCRDRDLTVLADMCMRSKPHKRPTMPNVELSVLRCREKARQLLNCK